MDFSIRETTIADVRGTATVLVKSWQSAYRSIVPDDYLDNLSVDDRAERIIKDFDENKGVSFPFVAELNGEVIGTLLLAKCRDEGKTQAGEIIAIYLFEEHWDKGFGRKMMEFSLEALERMGYQEAIIWVFEANNRARHFYEKFGFALDGATQELTCGKPLTAVRYALEL